MTTATKIKARVYAIMPRPLENATLFDELPSLTGVAATCECKTLGTSTYVLFENRANAEQFSGCVHDKEELAHLNATVLDPSRVTFNYGAMKKGGFDVRDAIQLAFHRANIAALIALAGLTRDFTLNKKYPTDGQVNYYRKQVRDLLAG